MDKLVRRLVSRALARSPGAYRAILKTLNRGSVEKRLYLTLVKRNDVVFDIGANVGHFTRLFSDLTGTGGEVHAFEPVPATFQELLTNVRRFPACQNVVLKPFAVGDRNDMVQIAVPGSDHGQAALIRHSHGSWKTESPFLVEARMICLDQYAEGFSRLDFVKADVEGAELLVLRGGQTVLRRLRPKMFLEHHSEWMSSFGWGTSDLVLLLRQIGYSYFYGVDVNVKRLTCPENAGERAILCSWEEIDGLA
jgi:FkbM family methyltransferase